MVGINPWNLSARCHLRERNQSKYLRGKMAKNSSFLPSLSLSTNLQVSPLLPLSLRGRQQGKATPGRPEAPAAPGWPEARRPWISAHGRGWSSCTHFSLLLPLSPSGLDERRRLEEGSGEARRRERRPGSAAGAPAAREPARRQQGCCLRCCFEKEKKKKRRSEGFGLDSNPTH